MKPKEKQSHICQELVMVKKIWPMNFGITETEIIFPPLEMIGTENDIQYFLGVKLFSNNLFVLPSKPS